MVLLRVVTANYYVLSFLVAIIIIMHSPPPSLCKQYYSTFAVELLLELNCR